MLNYQIPDLSPGFQTLKDPHNIFLYMATNFGILGLLSMLWLFYIRNNLVGFSILAFTLITFIGNLSVATTLYTATGQMFSIATGLLSHCKDEEPSPLNRKP